MTKGSTITIYKYLMGVNSSEEEELFSVVKGLSWLRAIRLNWTKQNINWITFVMLAGCKGSSQETWWKQWCLAQLKRHGEPSSIYVMDLGTSPMNSVSAFPACPHPHRPVCLREHTPPWVRREEGVRVVQHLPSADLSPSFGVICCPKQEVFILLTVILILWLSRESLCFHFPYWVMSKLSLAPAGWGSNSSYLMLANNLGITYLQGCHQHSLQVTPFSAGRTWYRMIKSVQEGNKQECTVHLKNTLVAPYSLLRKMS